MRAGCIVKMDGSWLFAERRLHADRLEARALSSVALTQKRAENQKTESIVVSATIWRSQASKLVQ
jgi:hypothetical protein